MTIFIGYCSILYLAFISMIELSLLAFHYLLVYARSCISPLSPWLSYLYLNFIICWYMLELVSRLYIHDWVISTCISLFAGICSNVYLAFISMIELSLLAFHSLLVYARTCISPLSSWLSYLYLHFILCCYTLELVSRLYIHDWVISSCISFFAGICSNFYLAFISMIELSLYAFHSLLIYARTCISPLSLWLSYLYLHSFFAGICSNLYLAFISMIELSLIAFRSLLIYARTCISPLSLWLNYLYLHFVLCWYMLELVSHLYLYDWVISTCISFFAGIWSNLYLAFISMIELSLLEFRYLLV